MTQFENANLIMYLRDKGWSDTEINELILFMTTHKPTEAEVKERAKQKKDERP